MIRVLHITGFLLLFLAGILLAQCGRQWVGGTAEPAPGADRPLEERLRLVTAAGDRRQPEVMPPLVRQAAAFALYLKPPPPPAPKPAPAPPVSTSPAPRPAAPTPWFRLLATSHYRSRPEKSLALISEPGKGDRWVRPGERVGHFVFERIEPNTVVYRDGAQRHEMAVALKSPAPIAQRRSGRAAAHVTRPPVKVATASPAPEPATGAASIVPVVDPGPE